jgi:hypothetical protein
MLAQDVGEAFPLRLLCIGDLERCFRVGEAGFDALARKRERAPRRRRALSARFSNTLLGLRDDD